ncbi:MAG: 6-pyruvoyl trahydropterin synthase family protein [Rubinisphaera brasiliensis]|uniref:6-pyruvoyl trahydropterin synthase family protein n=1 Tax=Rubinisphaera brasiliensis TaxID=119 RepID=UPI0039196F2E
MLIEKEYKFYAAHRNEELRDKCSNIHGHRYGLKCSFEVERNGSISTLFGEFDEKVEPLIKQRYDHGMLLNIHDPLLQSLNDHMERTGENLKLKLMNGPTSVENLAFMLFTEITELGFRLVRLDVRETDSSVVTYTIADWNHDRETVFRDQSPCSIEPIPSQLS